MKQLHPQGHSPHHAGKIGYTIMYEDLSILRSITIVIKPLPRRRFYNFGRHPEHLGFKMLCNGFGHP